MKVLELVSVFLLLFVFSCEKDPCKDIECGPGYCLYGDCRCPLGFEGESCNICNEIEYVFPGVWEMKVGDVQKSDITFFKDGTYSAEERVTNIWDGTPGADTTALTWEIVENGKYLVLEQGQIGQAYKIINFDCDNIEVNTLALDGSFKRISHSE